MDRLHGMEAFLGIGGGNLVSEESEQCLDEAVALRKEGKLDEAKKKLKEAMKDPNNLDAEIEYACMRPSAQEAIEILVETEKKGKALLIKTRGPLAFDDKGGDVGNYWDILETRPYMRVLLILERLYFETKQYDKCCPLMEELMRLRPGDNLSVRKYLGTALIRVGRYKHALSFAQQWLAPNRQHTPQRGGGSYPKPDKKPQYTKDQEHQLCTGTFNHPSEGRGLKNGKMFISRKCLADLLHTGALASFKLWGDNEQARQYLRIGARVNPGILLKILGKVERPRSVNKEARLMNGPEDARDYLWYGQDMWMADDVWNWANNYQPAKEAILKDCSRPGCPVREKDACEFKRCSDCHLVSYCGALCQKEDWKNHKPTCRQRLEFKKTTKSFGRGQAIPENGPSILSPDFSQTMGAGTVNEAVKRVGKAKKRNGDQGVEVD